MPEWVYLAGWLAVPVACVLGSLWWHEREHHRDVDELLLRLQNGNRDLLATNHQLRVALHAAEREQQGMRHAMVQRDE